MKVIECSGQTREEAIQQGLDDLGVGMDEVERIDIIDEGSKGFLGIGKRSVRVRITVDIASMKPQRNQPRRDNRNNDRPARQQNRDGRRNQEASKQRQDSDQPGRDDEAGDSGERKPRRSKRQSQANRGQQQQDRNNQGRPSDSQSRRGRSGRGQAEQGEGEKSRSQSPRSGRVRQEANEAEKKNVSLTEEGTEASRLAEQFEKGGDWQEAIVVEPIPEGAREEEAIEPISDEQGNEMAAMLKEIVDRMGLQASVDFIRDAEGSPCLAMKSDQDSAILIGKHGITLNALQYLINRMLTVGDNENTERLMVDVGEYVSRRRSSLVDMANKMALRAKETGRNVKLKPLSPQERRIVHLALEKDSDVRTFSQGDSLYRSVIINPVNVRRSSAPRPQRPTSRRRRPGQHHGTPQSD